MSSTYIVNSTSDPVSIHVGTVAPNPSPNGKCKNWRSVFYEN